mmetsp:Transcript_46744/g.145948  ORF Transcript_46744/g.145948 Transcript_46744/m.145948 type:complete len:166 (-) Transcript_46744:37-534(-)|eukprot:CAMPEP_0118877694 /NCGR_PEP_ID=MMETSP1163-20130328/17900_1 /TAXON_ID=124430 /ORGANISM="Phaeomonas parva, Strain CCMP2877" /LENGTH=165 /DNA_ID=CAMNT_0006813441 /DNA_START=93 /DNA_END=590 /DNA_ORIENTATION=+
MHATALVRLLPLALLLCLATALDVSWIPTDPDGPLPYSKKYRDSLGRLCTLIESGKPVQPELEEIRPRMNKICAKLRREEARHGGGGFGLDRIFDRFRMGGKFKPLRLFLIYCGLGVAAFAAFKLGLIDKALLALGVEQAELAEEIDVDAMRQARLRRFFEEKED